MVRLHKKANRNLHVVTGLVILSCWKSNYWARYPSLPENGLRKWTAGVTTNDKQYTLDQRVAASFILYPKPFGVQAEYNIGKLTQ
jgi:hypothetical protein